MYEYDELYFHKDSCADVRKTMKLMNGGAKTVLRLRRGCGSLNVKSTKDCTYMEVCVETQNTYLQATATASTLNLTVKSETELKRSIDVGTLAFNELCHRERCILQEIKKVFGSNNLNVLLKIHGIRTRIWNQKFRKGVEWLLTKLDNDASRLPTVMCIGLASRLDNASFLKGVVWLLTKLDASRLPTVMCNGLASRLDNASFQKGVDWLLTKLDNDASRLPTVMCNGLASRLDNASFQKGVEWLLTKLDNDASRLGCDVW